MSMKRVLSAALCLLAVRSAAADELTLDALFPTDRVVDVQIQVEEEDWDKLRFQTRTIFSALAEARKLAPIPGPFTYVPATVTIDGVDFGSVGIRKKGFIGSLSTTRPSLKIKLNLFDPERNVGGLNNLTLNNNKQDVSQVSQLLGYGLFNAAGSPAPRCAFAHVTVNRKSLGIYSHVESLRKPLLKRGFGNARGTSYEGTVVDFYEGWDGSFERKSGDDEVGRAKIQQLIGALNGGGDTLLLSSESEGRLRVPTSDDEETWMSPGFDDSLWVKGRGGVGYEKDAGYESLFRPEFDLREKLHGKDGSVYLRIPFEIEDLSKVIELTLRVKYDDGFVAYINGHRVASANAPEEPKWNSRSTGPNDDRAAATFQPFYISQHRDKLQEGANLLALHGLNVQPSSSDLLFVVELRSGESSSREAVAAHVDLDAFYTFWAVEGLLGFWDGYSGNNNNFFLYLNPETEKFHFLPWGADSLFVRHSKINRDRRVPLSVKTEGLIAHRLYQIPSERERYLRTLRGILNEHWNEEKLLSETDRIETLLEPYLKESRSQRNFSRELEKTREFIRTRREEIDKETAGGMPEWTKPPSEPILMPADGGRFGRRGRGPGREGGKPKDDIWSAARRGDIEAISSHLNDVDVNAKDLMGSTALSWAAGLGRSEAVEFLLAKAADPNARNRDGTTPLDGTAKEMEEEAVDFLFGWFQVKVDPEKVNAAKPKIAELLRKHGGKPGKPVGERP